MSSIPIASEEAPFEFLLTAAIPVPKNININCKTNIPSIKLKRTEVSGSPLLYFPASAIEVIKVTILRIIMLTNAADNFAVTTLFLETGFTKRNSEVLSRSSC